MKNDILLLEPIFKERIWGGNKLKTVFNYNTPSNSIGECWGISAHKEGSSIIKNGDYAGKTLAWLYQNRKDYFGNIKSVEFPLLIKIIDANDDLSIQVHPDDEYAKNFNDLGKTECWYILDCKENAVIVYGHQAKTKKQLLDAINSNEWDKILLTKKIKAGDFIYVPAGKIHAITKGTLLLETQQSSDITFRLYDYNRKDNQGNYRKLHLEEAINATNIPDILINEDIIVKNLDDNEITLFIKSKYFVVEKWKISSTYQRKNPLFILATVINGNGIINNQYLQKGDNFIIPSFVDLIDVKGSIEIIVSYL